MLKIGSKIASRWSVRVSRKTRRRLPRSENHVWSLAYNLGQCLELKKRASRERKTSALSLSLFTVWS